MVRILRGFGCRVLISDKEKVAEQCLELDARQVSHDVLLKEADSISFHVPLTDQTRHMVNSKSIEQVTLINVSRGAIFNSIDVYDALQRDKQKCLQFSYYFSV